MTDQTPVPLGQGVAMSQTGGGFSVTPTQLSEIRDFAVFMAKSNAGIPAFLRGNGPDCAAVIMQAMRWGMDPYAVAQCSYKVKDIIAYEAKLIAAVANTRSGLDGRLQYEFEGSGDDLTCTVTGTIDGQELTYTSPPIGAITTKNSPLWKSDPSQQLGYFSARSWVRRHTPEVMLGVYDRDEAQGMKDVTPSEPKTSLLDRLGNSQETHTDSEPEGFGTVATETTPEPKTTPDEALNAQGDAETASSGPLTEADQGEAGDTPPGEAPSPALGHLPGEQRRSVQAFAKVYFGGMSPKERDQIAAEYEGLREQSEDVSKAMDTIMMLIGMREVEKLGEFVGLTEAELKEAA